MSCFLLLLVNSINCIHCIRLKCNHSEPITFLFQDGWLLVNVFAAVSSMITCECACVNLPLSPCGCRTGWQLYTGQMEFIGAEELTDKEKEIINSVLARAELIEAMEQERIGWDLLLSKVWHHFAAPFLYQKPEGWVVELEVCIVLGHTHRPRLECTWCSVLVIMHSSSAGKMRVKLSVVRRRLERDKINSPWLWTPQFPISLSKHKPQLIQKCQIIADPVLLSQPASWLDNAKRLFTPLGMELKQKVNPLQDLNGKREIHYEKTMDSLKPFFFLKWFRMIQHKRFRMLAHFGSNTTAAWVRKSWTALQVINSEC